MIIQNLLALHWLFVVIPIYLICLIPLSLLNCLQSLPHLSFYLNREGKRERKKKKERKRKRKKGEKRERKRKKDRDKDRERKRKRKKKKKKERERERGEGTSDMFNKDRS